MRAALVSLVTLLTLGLKTFFDFELAQEEQDQLVDGLMLIVGFGSAVLAIVQRFFKRGTK